MTYSNAYNNKWSTGTYLPYLSPWYLHYSGHISRLGVANPGIRSAPALYGTTQMYYSVSDFEKNESDLNSCILRAYSSGTYPSKTWYEYTAATFCITNADILAGAPRAINPQPVYVFGTIWMVFGGRGGNGIWVTRIDPSTYNLYTSEQGSWNAMRTYGVMYQIAAAPA